MLGCRQRPRPNLARNLPSPACPPAVNAPSTLLFQEPPQLPREEDPVWYPAKSSQTP